MPNTQSLGVLRNRISSGKIVLFTGAGVNSEWDLPSGGHVAARWRPTEPPSGGQVFCP